LGKPKSEYDGLIFVGKTFERNGVTIEHGRVYPAAIIAPDFGFTHYQLALDVDGEKVYLPYACTADIFEEWMVHAKR
jgi:hypothetical protein